MSTATATRPGLPTRLGNDGMLLRFDCGRAEVGIYPDGDNSYCVYASGASHSKCVVPYVTEHQAKLVCGLVARAVCSGRVNPWDQAAFVSAVTLVTDRVKHG